MIVPPAKIRWQNRPTSRDKPWLVHLNTSAAGGGVAELLERLTRSQTSDEYVIGWAVMSASPEFFAFTKNIHHLFHGHGSIGLLHNLEGTRVYRETLSGPFEEFTALLLPGDTIVLHDPQTLGLVHALRVPGVRIVWHCHIGSVAREEVDKEDLWTFFEEEFDAVDAVAVARSDYLGGAAFTGDVFEFSPAIDPVAPKNRPLTEGEKRRLIERMGLTGHASMPPEVGRLWQKQGIPEGSTTVLQVSRWDPLKDMVGVLRAFSGFREDTHLILAGPDPREVPDDPEGQRQLDSVLDRLNGMAPELQKRVHVVALSMIEKDLNALRINALQRRADIVVQKSLEEGFGLTATEAMHKGKPVIASSVGGMTTQICNGVSGLLVHPTDDDEFIRAVNMLSDDRELRIRLGKNAQSTVQKNFLLPRLVADYEGKMMQGRATI